MTTTGTLLVETTNDEQFEVGASYSITLLVSQSLVGFGVTKLSDPPVEDSPDTESTGVVGGGTEPEVQSDSVNSDSTPPATP